MKVGKTRMRTIKAMYEAGSRDGSTIGEIAARIGSPPITVYKNLELLNKAGCKVFERYGKFYYPVADVDWKEVADKLRALQSPNQESLF